jgi:hypothetical protein
MVGDHIQSFKIHADAAVFGDSGAFEQRVIHGAGFQIIREIVTGIDDDTTFA